MVAWDWIRTSVSALWGPQGTTPLPRNISGGLTSLTTRLAFYFGEIGLTDNSQSDYPRLSEFSDEFSFSVISFYDFYSVAFVVVHFYSAEPKWLCPLRNSGRLRCQSILTLRYPYILYRWNDMVVRMGIGPMTQAWRACDLASCRTDHIRRFSVCGYPKSLREFIYRLLSCPGIAVR